MLFMEGKAPWIEGRALHAPRQLKHYLLRHVHYLRRHVHERETLGRSLCRENLEHMRQSRPDSGLGMSHFQYESL